MRVFVYTLGCRLNQCESEGILDAFSKAGFDIVDEYADADITVVNTCTVTSKAEQKARRMLRLFSKTASVVLATGCYAEMSRDEIAAIAPNIVVFSLLEKASILELPGHINNMVLGGMSVLDSVRSFRKGERSVFSFDASSFSYHSRAYLKIQDGCDNACGYCRTTIARGPSRWLDSETVVDRVKKLEEEGFREVMLTGVNLTNYDHSGEGLGGLMEKILSAVGPGIRFRLSSMEPDHVDDRLLDAISDERVMPHFHIPIQTASDRLLKIVGRKYSVSHVEYIIRRLREIKDDPFIACDCIAGLPGEREEDWKITYDFLERNDFSALHVFPYSPREGTPLYGSKLKIEERVRDERALELRKLSQRHERSYIMRQMGRSVEILAEKNGEGTTGNYLKAKIIAPEGYIKEGELYKGTITSVFPLQVSIV
ncbi:MAG: tRNA (N(6)-L-threonylcarbamoyladenosine(37)-C(2))-methylthiotransferase MtaB [Candidatus Ornithospirochaeta sp.]